MRKCVSSWGFFVNTTLLIGRRALSVTVRVKLHPRVVSTIHSGKSSENEALYRSGQDEDYGVS